MADDEVKTEQLKIGGAPVGAFVKLFERVGLAPILLAVFCVAGWQYVRYESSENIRRQVVMIKKLNRIESIVRADKGCRLNLNEQRDEDEFFEKQKEQ